MSNFEWQTEDDYDWDEPDQKPTPPSSSRFGQIGIVVLILALLGGLGWALNSRLRETVETATEETEADVSASFRLLHESASSRDIEVFNALLSGLDPEWTIGYQLMVGDNGILDRSVFGWDLSSSAPEISEVFLSPSLRAAEITATVEYAIPIGNGLHETVQIAQPAVFREGTTRWLYAPPEEGYWGERATQIGNYLTVTYPTRDEELILALQSDLEVAISNRCADACGQTFIHVEFSTSPAALADMRMPPLQLDNNQLTLPTPTLVGLPVDQAGYRALLGGYADLILTSLFTAQSGYRCCDHITMHRAQSLWALKSAALRAWPLTVEDYEAVLGAHSSFVEWPLGWEINRPSAISAEQQNIAYALVEFLNTTYPPVSAEFNVDNLSTFDSAIDWIAATALNSGAEITASSADEWKKQQFDAFQQFLTARIMALQPRDVNIAVPDSQFMLACNSAAGSTLQQLQTGNNAWQAVATFEQPIIEINSLPEPASLWIQFGNPETANKDPNGLSAIWRNGALQPLTELRLSYTGASNPNNGDLIVRSPLIASAGNATQLPIHYALDPAMCTVDSCPIAEQGGLPIWSDSGQHMLVRSAQNQLSLRDANGETLDEQVALAAFWFDEQRYIWQSTIVNLNITHVDDPQNSEEWLAWSDLEAALPPEMYGVPSLTHFFWRDEQPDQLYIGAFNLLPNSSGNVIFWDRATQSAEILPFNDTRILWASPEERYLLLRENALTNNGVSVGKLHLYDTLAKSTYMTFAADSDTAFSWIGDTDQWATLTTGTQIRLFDLYSGKQQFITMPADSCVSGDWVAPMEES